MPYYESWDVFYQKAEELFRADPLNTRYVTKYRHCDGKLVLKVTDDRVCLKFRTDQAQDLKRLDKLNQLFFMLTVHGEITDSAVAALASEPAAPTPASPKVGGSKGKGAFAASGAVEKKKQRGRRQ
mmetsp:Transcript_862/g.1020  ORF Transcript_862/g.1020 Transcript_862/m.1020 type:complete len:126 (-) Transcript_862:678-1055(-)